MQLFRCRNRAKHGTKYALHTVSGMGIGLSHFSPIMDFVMSLGMNRIWLKVYLIVFIKVKGCSEFGATIHNFSDVTQQRPLENGIFTS
jgi:hypothetical protein